VPTILPFSLAAATRYRCRDRACDLAKKLETIGLREWRHEADAGAAFNTVDQHRSQLIQRGFGGRTVENDDLGRITHARSSFDATVASALSR